MKTFRASSAAGEKPGSARTRGEEDATAGVSLDSASSCPPLAARSADSASVPALGIATDNSLTA